MGHPSRDTWDPTNPHIYFFFFFIFFCRNERFLFKSGIRQVTKKRRDKDTEEKMQLSFS